MDRHEPPKLEASSRRSGRLRKAAALLSAIVGATAGCSQPGPFLHRQTMMGALKSNVAQLESEKDRLAKQLADQKSETRRLENELAAVEDKNGELAARLDDARTLIGRQGGDADDFGATARVESEPDRLAPGRSIPARAQPRGRRAPFAQIPNERRPLDEPEAGGGDDLDLPPPRTPRRRSDDQSRLNDRSPWLPVAQDKTAPDRRLR